MKKEKYIVVRNLHTNTYYDSYDCYHDASVNIGVLTEHIVELTNEEIQAVQRDSRFSDLSFVPVLDKIEIQEVLSSVKKVTEEKRRKEEAKNKKRQEAAAKRRETLRKKKQAKELAELERLKGKYENGL